MASSTSASASASTYRPSSSRPGGASSAAPHRRHSLFGTEDRIVLDIGSRWSKVGFSGEAAPRRVFKTIEATRRPGVDAYFRTDDDGVSLDDGDDDDDDDDDELMWDLNISRGTNTQARQSKHDLLLAKLTVLLRRVYQEYLMTDSTARKVILVENPFMPSIIREHICTVLFDNLRVPSISIMSAPLLATLATGTSTCLVLSVGVLETSVLPVYHGRPLLSHFNTSTRAGRRLHRRLKALLLRYAKYIEPAALSATNSTLASRTRTVPPEMLTPAVLDEVLVKTCFVSKGAADSGTTGNQLKSEGTPSKSVPDPTQGPDWQQDHTGDHHAIAAAKTRLAAYREEDDTELLESLKGRYTAAAAQGQSTHRTGHLLLSLRVGGDVEVQQPVMHDGVTTLSSNTAATPSTVPSAFSASIKNRLSPTPTPTSERSSKARAGGELLIPGWIRSHVADFFFESDEEDDVDSASLTTLVLSTLLRLPVDVRKDMASSVLVTGGSTSLAGFANRLKQECTAVLEESEKSNADSSAAAAKYSHNVALNTTRTDVDVRPSRGNRTRTRTKRDVLYAPLVPLRSHLAVINDHHPPLSSSHGRPLSRVQGGGDDDDDAHKVHSAPCIPPTLHSWFGASLLGSLKISSKDTIRRDEWDSQREAQMDALLAKMTADGVALADDDATAAGSLSPPAHSRPSVLQRRSRGSFMGTAGARGIEGGAFGGLDVVARHLSAPRGTGGGHAHRSTTDTP